MRYLVVNCNSSYVMRSVLLQRGSGRGDGREGNLDCDQYWPSSVDNMSFKWPNKKTSIRWRLILEPVRGRCEFASKLRWKIWSEEVTHWQVCIQFPNLFYLPTKSYRRLSPVWSWIYFYIWTCKNLSVLYSAGLLMAWAELAFTKVYLTVIFTFFSLPCCCLGSSFQYFQQKQVKWTGTFVCNFLTAKKVKGRTI